MMDGDGSGPTRLTYNATDDLGATWSPDGRTVAFLRNALRPGCHGTIAPIGPPNVYLIDMETRLSGC